LRRGNLPLAQRYPKHLSPFTFTHQINTFKDALNAYPVRTGAPVSRARRQQRLSSTVRRQTPPTSAEISPQPGWKTGTLLE